MMDEAPVVVNLCYSGQFGAAGAVVLDMIVRAVNLEASARRITEMGGLPRVAGEMADEARRTWAELARLVTMSGGSAPRTEIC